MAGKPSGGLSTYALDDIVHRFASTARERSLSRPQTRIAISLVLADTDIGTVA